MNVDTQAHLTTLRGLLLFKRNELQADLHASQLSREQLLAGTTAHDVADLKDLAADAQRADVSGKAEDAMRRELAQCQAALQRLDDGCYGDCIGCGEPIPWPRLLAQPAAQRCADCQRAAERANPQ